MSFRPPTFRGLLQRLVRLLRETWWLLLIVAAIALAFGKFLEPLLGWVAAGIVVPVYVWFALIRVEDDPPDHADPSDAVDGDPSV